MHSFFASSDTYFNKLFFLLGIQDITCPLVWVICALRTCAMLTSWWTLWTGWGGSWRHTQVCMSFDQPCPNVLQLWLRGFRQCFSQEQYAAVAHCQSVWCDLWIYYPYFIFIYLTFPCLLHFMYIPCPALYCTAQVGEVNKMPYTTISNTLRHDYTTISNYVTISALSCIALHCSSPAQLPPPHCHIPTEWLVVLPDAE